MPAPSGPVVLLVGGSTRRGATIELAALPAFDPDDDRDPLPPGVAGLRDAVHAAGVVTAGGLVADPAVRAQVADAPATPGARPSRPGPPA